MPNTPDPSREGAHASIVESIGRYTASHPVPNHVSSRRPDTGTLVSESDDDRSRLIMHEPRCEDRYPPKMDAHALPPSRQ